MQMRIYSEVMHESDTCLCVAVGQLCSDPLLQRCTVNHKVTHEPVGPEGTSAINRNDISLQHLPAPLFPRCPLPPTSECFIVTASCHCCFGCGGWDRNNTSMRFANHGSAHEAFSWLHINITVQTSQSQAKVHGWTMYGPCAESRTLSKGVVEIMELA